jgi:serine/threonine-protein kinase
LSTDAQLFLHHLERSQLLSEDEIKDAARRLDKEDAWKVADDLVSDGILTRFQSRQLLAGNSKGFLLGPYRILDQVGQGGMGIVYKAIHTKMRRLVAVKVLRPAVLTDKELGRHLFQREALAAAQLDHPNIVAVYDADEACGVHFLVMEFVDGTNFKRLVQGYGPLAIPLACSVVRQVAEALQYAHERGFVHRDIKPSNMLLARLPSRQTERIQMAHCLASGPGKAGYRVKVLDFGLSRVCPEGHFLGEEDGTLQAAPGVVWGTIDYISPEQLLDVHAVDSRSDLYSLGSSLYYLLTGQVPYGEGSLAQRLIRRGAREPEAVSRLRPEIPPAVVKMIERLMERCPANRFQTAGELIEALNPWCTRDSSESVVRSVPQLATEVPSEPIEEAAPQRKDQTDRSLAINREEHSPLVHASELNEPNPVVALLADSPANTAGAKQKPIWWSAFAVASVVIFAKKATGSLFQALQHCSGREGNARGSWWGTANVLWRRRQSRNASGCFAVISPNTSRTDMMSTATSAQAEHADTDQ